MLLNLRSFRRRFRPRLVLLSIAVLLFLDYHLITTSIPAPIRTSALPTTIATEKIIIVSIHRNSEYMLRSYWNAALLSLVAFLGSSNVFVSIVESGSLDDTKGALRDLEEGLKDLGVETKFVFGEDVYGQMESLKHVPSDKHGWIHTGRKQGDEGWEKRRIPHLAALRNQAMEPLLQVEQRFDRVLWINDVVFTNEDVATLLATREGDYAAACAMDFSKSAETYYDTFALRDSSGLKTGTGYYPYFLSRPSLQTVLSLQPVPVKSCWNGLVSFDASSFYASPQLKFRGISDSLAKEHLEGSECCLIHSDNQKLRSEKGVWMNPNVRVTYNSSTYVRVNPQGPLPESIRGDSELQNVIKEGEGKGWPGKWEKYTGTWMNRKARWLERVTFWTEKRMVELRVRKWLKEGEKKGEKREEMGLECLVNEMQVMFETGWQHV